MVRHHQRPGRQRHELPRDQKAECVVGQHDEIHAGEIGRERTAARAAARFRAGRSRCRRGSPPRRRDWRPPEKTPPAHRGGNARRCPASRSAARAARPARRQRVSPPRRRAPAAKRSGCRHRSGSSPPKCAPRRSQQPPGQEALQRTTIRPGPAFEAILGLADRRERPAGGELKQSRAPNVRNQQRISTRNGSWQR